MESTLGNYSSSSRPPANDPDFDRGSLVDNPTLVNTRISKRRPAAAMVTTTAIVGERERDRTSPVIIGDRGSGTRLTSTVPSTPASASVTATDVGLLAGAAGAGGPSAVGGSGKLDSSVFPKPSSGTIPRLPHSSKPSVKYKTALLSNYYDSAINTSVDKLVSEIQTAYYDISKLEVACSNLIEILEKSPFNDQFVELYHLQTNLVDRYYDFMFLAHHPSGNSFTRGLTKKYKIAIRMWNKGIFKFLDLLRTRVPESHSLVNKFIYHCFSLLGMLVDPPYESRHMWLEALGDLARFMMAIASSGYGDWRGAAQYWYIRASNRSPGIGRLFHHCAVVCIYRIDSLFYFCKSLTAVQPFEPSRDIITSLFASNQDNENDSAAGKFIKMHEILFGSGPMSTVDSLAESIGWTIENSGSQLYELKHRAAIIAFCDIAALLGYGRNTLAKLFCDRARAIANSSSSSADAATLSSSSASFNSSDHAFNSPSNNFPANYTTVPIPGLTGHIGAGTPPSLAAVSPSFTNTNITTSANSSNIDNNGNVAWMAPSIPIMPIHSSFSLLQAFLRLDKVAGAPHAVVWLYFLISLNDATCNQHIHTVFPQFPVEDLVYYLNDIMSYVSTNYIGTSGDLKTRIANWRQSMDEPTSFDYLETLRRQLPADVQETINPIPLARQRPLSEELLMQGFIWSPPMRADLVAEHECSSIDDLCPAFPGLPSVAPVRLVRVVELGLELAQRCQWLYFDVEFKS